MWLGVLLIVLAAFAFASAGLYYLMAILVGFGKLIGALVVGGIGGTWLFLKGMRWVAIWSVLTLCRLVVLVRDLSLLGADEAQSATGRVHRAGMAMVEWLKRTYVRREKRGRGL